MGISQTPATRPILCKKQRHVVYSRINDTSYIVYLLYTTLHEMSYIVGLLPYTQVVEDRILSYIHITKKLPLFLIFLDFFTGCFSVLESLSLSPSPRPPLSRTHTFAYSILNVFNLFKISHVHCLTFSPFQAKTTLYDNIRLWYATITYSHRPNQPYDRLYTTCLIL